MKRDIAIIGAGLAGATAAYFLGQAGFAVTVYEKSGGTGGRLATRRTDFGAFDHGAQFISARDLAFVDLITQLEHDGAAALWDPSGKSRDHDWYVGAPGMSAFVKPLLADVKLHTRKQIAHCEAHDEGVLIVDEAGAQYSHDRVIVTAPAMQARKLLLPFGDDFAPLDDVIYAPCWAGMFAFNAVLDMADMTRGDDNGPLAVVARNGAKPGREGTYNYIVHGGGAWSDAHLERDKEAIAEVMLAALLEVAGSQTRPAYMTAHRWRYARVEKPAGVPFMQSACGRAFVCGDGLLGGRAEAAFQSAKSVCDLLLTH